MSSTRESSRLELPARSHTCPTWSRERLLGRAFEALKPVPVIWDVHAPMSTLRLKRGDKQQGPESKRFAERALLRHQTL